MTEAKTNAKKLKALRELSGLSQWDVAAFLDRDRSAVSMIENGHLVMSEDEAQRLVEFLQRKARTRYADLVTA